MENHSADFWQVPESVITRSLDGDTLVIHLDRGLLFHCDGNAEAFFECYVRSRRKEGAGGEWDAWWAFVEREGLVVRRNLGESGSGSALDRAPRYLDRFSDLKANAVGLATTNTTKTGT